MSSDTLRAKYGADADDRVGWAVVLATVAGITLGIAGLFQFLAGLSAALDDQVYVNTARYVYRFDLTTWGWIHMVLGVIAIVLGFAMLAGRTWAVVGGLVVAILACVANFLFLPYQPLWALVQIAFSVAVVWALSVLLGRSRS